MDKLTGNIMKTLRYIAIGLTSVLCLAACDRKVSYETSSYLTFTASSVNVDEDAGLLTIPVECRNLGGKEANALIKITDGTAVNGKEFEVVSPVNGVLTFSEGETSKDVILKLNVNSAFTGDKSFSMSLSSGSDDIVVGSFSTLNVTINDINHPLKNFIGTWTGTAVSAYDGTKYTISATISSDRSDDTFTKLVIKDLDPYMVSVMGYNSDKGYNVFNGTVNSAKTAVTIAGGSSTGWTYSSTYGPVMLFGVEGNSLTDLTLTLSNGKLVIASGYGIFVNTGSGYGVVEYYDSGIVLTKE